MVASIEFNDSIGALSGTVHELILKRLALCFKSTGIPLTAYQYQLMSRLWTADGIHQNKLAEMLNRDRSAITHMVDQLEKKKLAFRKRDERDKRANCVFLTVEGKSLEEKAQECAHQTIKTALEGLDENSYQSLMLALQQIKANLA